jgi:hypothetical protein
VPQAGDGEGAAGRMRLFSCSRRLVTPYQQIVSDVSSDKGVYFQVRRASDTSDIDPLQGSKFEDGWK